MLSYFIVDFDRIAFTIPYLGHPVTWYGIFFAGAFFLGFLIAREIFKRDLMSRSYPFDEAKKLAHVYLDKIIVFIILGTILGARFGHVFFYEWSYYRYHLLDILKVWEGGLASHGGALGVVLALLFFCVVNRNQVPKFSFLAILDGLVIPAALIGGFIRLGNFINQEILGKVTSLPWGVIFLHPMQKVLQIPLHPVQLYEAFSYFAIFAFLFILWMRRGKKIGEGIMSGAFFILVFGMRFFIEFLKLPQSDLLEEKIMTMGQILSIPFICIGFYLLFRKSPVCDVEERA